MISYLVGMHILGPTHCCPMTQEVISESWQITNGCCSVQKSVRSTPITDVLKETGHEALFITADVKASTTKIESDVQCWWKKED